MRRHHIWYALAGIWWLAAALGWFRHRGAQAALPALFGCCFFLFGIFLRQRDRQHDLKFPRADQRNYTANRPR